MPNIEFLPANDELLGVAPDPEPAISNMPSWWKDQPKFINNDSSIENGNYKATVKKCQAIFDGITTGYVLKAPVDIYIDTTENKIDIQIPSEFTHLQPHIISGHSESQVEFMPIDKNLYLPEIVRIHPLWVVKTPPGYSTLFMPLIHRENLPVHPVSAVVDTDRFASDGHLSFFVKKDFKGIIKQGTPIIQVLPFKREDWSHSLVTWEESKSLLNKQRKIVRSTFLNGYRKRFWSKKVYE